MPGKKNDLYIKEYVNTMKTSRDNMIKKHYSSKAKALKKKK